MISECFPMNTPAKINLKCILVYLRNDLRYLNFQNFLGGLRRPPTPRPVRLRSLRSLALDLPISQRGAVGGGPVHFTARGPH